MFCVLHNQFEKRFFSCRQFAQISATGHAFVQNFFPTQERGHNEHGFPFLYGRERRIGLLPLKLIYY